MCDMWWQRRAGIVVATALVAAACSAAPEPPPAEPTSSTSGASGPVAASSVAASSVAASSVSASSVSASSVSASSVSASSVAASGAALGGRPAEAARCADATLARLTPSQRSAQVLMIGVPVKGVAAAVSSVRGSGPGGVFLAGRSGSALPEIRRRIQILQQAAEAGTPVPLHVAVDQEGGQVQTLRGSGIGSMPAALTQGGWSEEVLRTRTAAWARALHDLGVTMNLAPVADTVPDDGRSNPPIGAFSRQYGSTPDTVAADIVTVTRATQQAGVIATLKHFPGLGRVRVNTDFSAEATDPLTSPDDPFLRPFAEGITAGAGAVMMSSARYPQLDPRQPAVFSARAMTLLRTELGFGGLIVSDDLGAAAAVRGVPVGRRAVAFIAAGGDLVLTVQPTDAATMEAALTAEAAGSPQFRRRLDDAVRRLLVSKYQVGMLRC